MDQITPIPLTTDTNPKIVHSQPLPIAWIKGAATIAPTQLNMLRKKLFTAIPVLAFRGINSVNIVVAMANINIDPIPKKNRAMS
jgi:hypothetical protein